MSEILSPWRDCRFCSSWQMVRGCWSLPLPLSLSLSLFSHLEAGHAPREVGPAQDPRACASAGVVSTRWNTTLSSKVNLHLAIDFKALCGEKLVTCPADFRGNGTRAAHRAGWSINGAHPLAWSPPSLPSRSCSIIPSVGVHIPQVVRGSCSTPSRSYAPTRSGSCFLAAIGHEFGTSKAVTSDSWLRRPRDRIVCPYACLAVGAHEPTRSLRDALAP